MRSAGGTNLGLAASVVSFTNATMACLAGPSFQDGSGSVCAQASRARTLKTAMAIKRANSRDQSFGFIYGLRASPCRFLMVFGAGAPDYAYSVGPTPVPALARTSVKLEATF